jgi:hypothetical protein
LLYNGDSLLQLWSQDAKVLDKDIKFQILISNNTDALASLASTQSSTPESLQAAFLSDLKFVRNNRKESVYQIATQSPRSVKIQES